ncbi:MAG: helix-turn-helix domain-containing protein [Rhizobiaceae bacterium]
MKAALPGLLAEIAKVAGDKAALAVAAEKGGTRAYFPARPTSEHWLSKAIGEDKAKLVGRELSSGHGGIELLVPMGPKASRIAVWQKISDMIEAGYSKPDIARACGVHERTVQNHRNDKVVTLENSLNQMDLFLAAPEKRFSGNKSRKTN